jgi:hypothetical protein
MLTSIQQAARNAPAKYEKVLVSSISRNPEHSLRKTGSLMHLPHVFSNRAGSSQPIKKGGHGSSTYGDRMVQVQVHLARVRDARGVGA